MCLDIKLCIRNDTQVPRYQTKNLHEYSTDRNKQSQEPVSLTIFCPQFKFDGYFALLLFRYWPSDRNKFLHMPRQHSCRAMYKIL